MKKIDILNKIVESNGSCTNWVRRSICEKCPLSQFKKKPNGNYFSCIEAVGAQDMSEEEADARYKETASKLLLDEMLDKILGEQDVSEQK